MLSAVFIHGRAVLAALLLLCLGEIAVGQPTCTQLGQTPATAFPVCGTSSFAQTNVPICGHTQVPVPVCSGDGALYTNKNPYWYKFTCFTAGTLGFVITPNDLGDDYDWQLFDVTGHSPDDVFTDKSLFVACNWSGESGKTGASSAGPHPNACAGYGQPLYSAMPTLKQGHQYLLLISHFTDSQSGYSLAFGGGTASITDTTPPKLKLATAFCDGSEIRLLLNKRMKCSSLAVDGSDFSLSPAVATVTRASAPACSSGFDMDSILLTLSNPIPPGSYTLTAKTGDDRNTLLDNCNNGVPVGDQVSFTVYPVTPTPMDSITPVACAPDVLQLVFRKNIRCLSIARDGSDFTVTGPMPVTVTSADGSCSNGTSPVVLIHLSAPITRAGTYRVTLQTGSDGNTLIDECGQETPAGSTIDFTAFDTVSAAFSYKVGWGCQADTIHYYHDGGNGVNQWQWSFENGSSSTQQNPVKIYHDYGVKSAQLIVSNGVCSDTAQADVVLDNALIAAFTYPDHLCPEDKAVFTDTSTGKITSWLWDFGNGVTSTAADPPAQTYPRSTVGKGVDYTIRLIIRNADGCADTATHVMQVLTSCYITVPNAFTPNGDGENDYLYPLNAWKTTKLMFRVYNRYGQLVFETRDWTNKWDGTIKGKKQPAGTYVWTLTYTNIETGEKFSLKGNTILVR